jgi:hypothetical protein
MSLLLGGDEKPVSEVEHFLGVPADVLECIEPIYRQSWRYPSWP